MAKNNNNVTTNNTEENNMENTPEVKEQVAIPEPPLTVEEVNDPEATQEKKPSLKEKAAAAGKKVGGVVKKALKIAGLFAAGFAAAKVLDKIQEGKSSDDDEDYESEETPDEE